MEGKHGKASLLEEWISYSPVKEPAYSIQGVVMDFLNQDIYLRKGTIQSGESWMFKLGKSRD